MIIRKIILSKIFIFFFFAIHAQCQFNPYITGPEAVCPVGEDTLWTQSYESFQWYKDGVLLQGETNQYLIVSGSDAGSDFSVKATINGCSELSPSKYLDAWMFQGVSISSDFHMVDENGVHVICVGDTAIFQLIPSIDLNIQWTENDLPISTNYPYLLVLTSDQVTSTDYYSVCGYNSACPDMLQCLGFQIPVRFTECFAGNSDQVKETRVQVFPNPVDDYLYIQIEEYLQGEMYVLSDQFGRQIYQNIFTENNTVLEISNLPHGIYFLTICNEVMKINKE